MSWMESFFLLRTEQGMDKSLLRTEQEEWNRSSNKNAKNSTG